MSRRPTTSGAATSVIRVRTPCGRRSARSVARRRRGRASARLVTAATSLVDLRTGRNAAEARIHELATDVVHIEELPAGDDLEERIADALKSALDDDFREARRIEAPRLASRARRRLKHEKQSYETKQDAKVLKGDLFAQVLQRDRNEENAAIMRKQHATMRRRVQLKVEAIEDSETILIRKRCEDGSIDEHRVDRDEASVLIDKEAGTTSEIHALRLLRAGVPREVSARCGFFSSGGRVASFSRCALPRE